MPLWLRSRWREELFLRCFLDFFSSFCIFALPNQVAHVPASDFSHSCTLRSDLDFLASISISANILPHPLHSGSLWLSLASLSVPVCNEEDDAGFTGKRFNSKMVVYSGSKTAYLPKMMTLYEQCIRVLQNNIDCEWIRSIFLSLWASLQGAAKGLMRPQSLNMNIKADERSLILSVA